jgi:tetratricopeptide (TPR) repeat protein
MNDRYLYFPMVGIAPLAALGIAGLVDGHSKAVMRGTGIVAAVLIVTLATAAAKRVKVWHDSYTLWRDAAAKVPESFMAWYNLASLFLTRGQPAEVRPILEKLRGMDPENAKVEELFGHYFYQTNDPQQAEIAYKRALAKNPGRYKSLLYLGNIYLSQGKIEGAVSAFTAAQKINPLSPDIAYSMACAESLLHRETAAVSSLGKAFRLGFSECESIRINPELDPLRGNPEFRRLLALYCGEKGNR